MKTNLIDHQVTHSVTSEEAGKRMDQVLALLPQIVSRNQAQKLLKEGAVWLNQVAQSSASKKLRFEDELCVTIPPPPSLDILPEAQPLDIFFEDEELLVLNKPSGVVVHPAHGHRSGTLVNYLLHHCKQLSTLGGSDRPGIVHRLDKDTSGVMIVAKTDEAHQNLAQQFKKHSIERRYKALVWGIPNQNQGSVDAPLGRHPKDRKRQAIVDSGKHAITHWRVIQRFSACSLLECHLETGRTHQIRVHLTSIAFPVIADPVYGKAPKNLRRMLSKTLQNQIAAFKRQALHAEHLAFLHPKTGEKLCFTSPLPEDFQDLLQLFLTS